MTRFGRRGVGITALAAVTILGACAERSDRAPIVYRGTQPTAPATAPTPATPMPAPTPMTAAADASGIVDYGGYRAIIARPGDTVASMAARAGLPATQLAAYNGLPTGHGPRAGDELILPPDAPSRVASAAPTVEAEPLETPAPAGLPEADPDQPAPESFDLDRIGATLETPAPVPSATPETTAAAPEPAQPLAPEPALSAAPPPTATPTEPAPREVAAAPTGPQPAPSTARFVRPVAGTIAQPFSRAAGPNRSDGVSYNAAAGSAVVAVADGQVALVSEALGGDLGTVILIRHPGQVLTVYGRVEAQVTQGERVSQGQVIGTVAPAPEAGEPSLHFEVRRGTEPVDPEPFFSS
jgi:murein DD-endopeptidase MepM/ murein hydrolase activator NlpD